MFCNWNWFGLRDGDVYPAKSQFAKTKCLFMHLKCALQTGFRFFFLLSFLVHFYCYYDICMKWFHVLAVASTLQEVSFKRFSWALGLSKSQTRNRNPFWHLDLTRPKSRNLFFCEWWSESKSNGSLTYHRYVSANKIFDSSPRLDSAIRNFSRMANR